jgi:hypothetical protein
MISHKSIIQILLMLVLCTLGTTSALAEYEPNDNYSVFVVSYQSATYATPICIGGECHSMITGPALIYAKQIIPNLALGLSGSQLQSLGKSSSIKATNISAFAEAIAGMGPSFDIGASLAVLNASTELCTTTPNSCVTSSDNGTNVGIFGKAFLTESKNVNLTLSYNSIYFHNSPDESVIGLSLVTILAKRHRLAFSADRVRDSSGNDISGGFGFGYSYIIYY